MGGQHTDPEGGDPLAGSGIAADNYDEESWADERSPWDDTEEETEEEKEGEQHARASHPEDEATKLDRNIRQLKDDQRFLVGVDLDRGARDFDWPWDEEGDERSRSNADGTWEPSEPVDWVNLPTNDPELAKPVPGELGQEGPLGMRSRWRAVWNLIGPEWERQLPWDQKDPAKAEAEADACRRLIFQLVKDAGFLVDPKPSPIPPPVPPDLTYRAGPCRDGKPGPSDEPAEVANQVLRDLANPRWEVCHGYVNGCVCSKCRARGGEVWEVSDEARVEHEVKQALARVYGRERRGGARNHSAVRGAARVFLDGTIAGTHSPFYRYDFRKAAKGVGKAARRDPRAIKDFLTATLVEKDGLRWIDPDQPRAFTLDELRPQQGRRSSPELVRRVRELVEMEAFRTVVADVLKIPRNTVNRITKPK